MVRSVAAAAALALPLVAAAPLRPSKRTTPVKRLTWTLAQDNSGSGFLNNWSFFTDADPTDGQVSYVQNSSLAYYASDSDSTILKVDDSSDLASGAPRQSTRITSNQVINENSLVIADFQHVPYGCATWPAFWLVGPNWPAGGEIDIFEGVNLNTANQMTLHTEPGCTQSGDSTGTVLQTDCDTSVNGNAGCGIQDTSGSSYGDAFNNNNGGVWATQWDSDGISIWFFPRASVPSDITSGSPAPAGWGTPSAFWSSSSCASSFFSDLQAVFDITLCGQWAGDSSVYDLTCSGSCSDEVMSGANFHDAYFQVNSVDFYTGA